MDWLIIFTLLMGAYMAAGLLACLIFLPLIFAD
jgi:hypothetical protein